MTLLVEKILLALFVIGFWLMIAIYCTGCFSDAGWRVSFGVAPVTAIDDKQGLEDKREGGRK